MNKILTFLGLCLLAISVFTHKAHADAALTPDEVREVFVGTPWHTARGATFMRADKSISYSAFNETAVWNYNYTIDRRGRVKTKFGTLTFFKRADGRYYFKHSKRGNRKIEAFPNRTFP